MIANRQKHLNTISGTTKKICAIKNNGFNNIYRVYTDKNIWPRGMMKVSILFQN